MNRRSAFLLVALAGLAGCADAAGPTPSTSTGSPLSPATGQAPSTAAGQAASASAGPRSASAGQAPDLAWPSREVDLAAGFCFTLVQGLSPAQVIDRLGGVELERVEWPRLVAPGDGEAGDAGRWFAGLARLGDWTLIVEDAGDLGVTGTAMRPLSEGRDVLAYRRDSTGRGRLLMLRDGEVLVDFDSGSPERLSGSRPGDLVPAMRAAGLLGGTDVTDPTGPALSFMAGRTGAPLTRELLVERTYLLVTVPKE